MSGGEVKDVEEITPFLGYRVFHFSMFVLLGFITVSYAYGGMIMSFVSYTPEHQCKVSIHSTRTGADVQRDSGIGPDSCSRYKPDGSSNTEPCLDGWVFSTDRFTSTIVSEWNLVCNNAWKVPFSTSLFFVGILIGSSISGHLSDWLSRKRMFFFTMILQGVIALIQATSDNWVMFCMLNCFRGVGLIPNYIASLLLGSEMLKSARVTWSLQVHSLGFAIGYALLLSNYFLPSWRMLLFACAIPSFLLIPMWWVIPESPRRLLQKGRVEEAEPGICNAAKVQAPEVIFNAADSLELMQKTGEEEQTYAYMHLIHSHSMRIGILTASFAWMILTMAFYGCYLNTSYVNVFLAYSISATIDIVVYVATWLMINRVPRPTFPFCTLMFCGIILLITQLIPKGVYSEYIIFGTMGIITAKTLLPAREIFLNISSRVKRSMASCCLKETTTAQSDTTDTTVKK